jgi:hypothetical protein
MASGEAGAATCDLTLRISNRRSAAPEAAETSPQTSLSWPRPAAANAAYSTNWPSRPGVIAPVSTSCDPIHRIATTLAKTMKMMIAVSTERARVDVRAAS